MSTLHLSKYHFPDKCVKIWALGRLVVLVFCHNVVRTVRQVDSILFCFVFFTGRHIFYLLDYVTCRSEKLRFEKKKKKKKDSEANCR